MNYISRQLVALRHISATLEYSAAGSVAAAANGMARKETETKPVLEMVQADGADEGCVTFVLHEEDHTLGNSLRYMVMKKVPADINSKIGYELPEYVTEDPQVEFCGYSIPHPSETKINFRIQSRGGVPATDLLRKGLKDLQDAAQHVRTTFEAKVMDCKDQPQGPMQ